MGHWELVSGDTYRVSKEGLKKFFPVEAKILDGIEFVKCENKNFFWKKFSTFVANIEWFDNNNRILEYKDDFWLNVLK